MKWKNYVHTYAAVVAVVCCLLPIGLCQDPTDVYRGCYFDGDGEKAVRAMTDLISCAVVGGVCQETCGPGERYCEGDSGMTIDVCRTLCNDTNFQYYGLEGGNQCFCGGSFSDPFVYGSSLDGMQLNCSDPCTGNANQTCGGEFRLKVYEFRDPHVDPGCFFPRSVPYATVMHVGVGVGETLTFTCEPGYELVGESTLTCMSNRTWSSDAVPMCNYTGVLPATTTEPSTTTTLSITTEEVYMTTENPATTVSATTTEPSTTTTPSITTEEVYMTTENPAATVSETTSPDVTPTEPESTTSAKPQTTKTTDKPMPTTKPQTSIKDLLPYIIGGSAALLLLLVILIIGITTCRVRKRSGNTNQDISLKPEDLAPVTLLNTGFNADDDPEADVPDILLASDTRLPTVENEYVNQSGLNHEMSTFSSGKNGATKGDDKFWEDPNAYAEMKPVLPMDYTPNPIYESADGAKAEEPNADRNSSKGDKASTVSDRPDDNVYDRVDGGKKWDSKENLISDDEDSIFADPDSTTATRL